jgi:NAD(P)-dependent dehydrogenase (short-subunit alcohol dehydrogenase family)
MPLPSGGERTTDQVLQQVDLSGRHVFVTGASSGLGAETARAVAAKGASVTLAARDVAKLEAVVARIAEQTGNRDLKVAALDLTDLGSVRECAKSWLASGHPLDLLINNAGVMACPLTRTSRGFEMQLATNHIGHFLLTCLLVPALRAAAPSRVVNLSSAGHRLSAMDFDDPHFERRDYDKWSAYGQSKTANVLFSVGLDGRLARHGVRAFAVHPGMIMTELGRHLDQDDIKELMSRTPGGGSKLAWKTVEQGAATSVWAATSGELAGRGGLYCADCHVASADPDAEDLAGVSPHAIDPAAAERLWSVSEEWVREKFAFA